MALTEYKRKRSFSKTPEPVGSKQTSGEDRLVFVIQKHKASHLHYDFRLEMRGALKSWAVPKGPSLNPADKRLAMLVEDHPFDYKDFEGIIPPGNYGAGTVIIWDEGTYEPLTKAKSKAEAEKILLGSFHSGSLKFTLHGKKLKGEFALVKMNTRGENAWLLIKHRDKYATEGDITTKDRSVISGKTIEELAANKKARKWISNRDASGKPKKNTKSGTADEDEDDSQSSSSAYEPIVTEILDSFGKKKKTKMPANIKPMLATANDDPVDHEDWMYELEWNGQRTIAYLNSGKVTLKSEKNKPLDKKFVPVYEALKEWPINAVIDGVITVVNEKGLPEPDRLETWNNEDDGILNFFVFDILWLQEVSLMDLPLTERHEILQKLIPAESLIKLSERFDSRGSEFIEAAGNLGLEAVIARKSDSKYVPGKQSKYWLKIKTNQADTEPENSAVKETSIQKRPKKNKNVQALKNDKDDVFLNPDEETQVKKIGGHALKFSNLNKLYWPKERITKRDMLNYYYEVSSYMLPYMKDRPQSLNRYPNGINGPSFYQKNVAGKVEDWLVKHDYENTSKEGHKTFLVCTDLASLMYIANLGCIEMNPWHSRISAPDYPDWSVIDLDPDTGNSFDEVIEVSLVVKKVLDAIGVPSYPKTSGSSGIHIYVPLGAQYTYEQSKQFAELVVNFVHDEIGDITSVERNPARRKGKIYLDFLQNRSIQTIAAPYSLRPKPGATVSAPLNWEEIRKGLRVQDFTIFNMPDRVKQEGDLFKGVLGKGINLDKVLKKMSTVFS